MTMVPKYKLKFKLSISWETGQLHGINDVLNGIVWHHFGARHWHHFSGIHWQVVALWTVWGQRQGFSCFFNLLADKVFQQFGARQNARNFHIARLHAYLIIIDRLFLLLSSEAVQNVNGRLVCSCTGRWLTVVISRWLKLYIGVRLAGFIS